LFVLATQCEESYPVWTRSFDSRERVCSLTASALLLCSKRRRRRRRRSSSSSFRPSSLRCSARPRRWRHWRTPALLISVVLVRFSWLF
jgi:hypothetical protein